MTLHQGTDLLDMTGVYVGIATILAGDTRGYKLWYLDRRQRSQVKVPRYPFFGLKESKLVSGRQTDGVKPH